MDMLRDLRLVVLREAARGSRALGLSWLTWQVSVTVNSDDRILCRSRFTSGAPKKVRGAVQASMAKLAREGLVYTRRSPEPGVARYEHGERDKYFQVRITPERAKQELIRLGKPYVPARSWLDESQYMTKSLL